MSRFKEYCKQNYLFVTLVVIIILLFIGLILWRTFTREKIEYTPDYKEISYDLKKFDSNEYKVITVEDQDMAINYYKEWIYWLNTDPKKAYSKLTKKCKIKYDTYEKFMEWYDRYKTVNTKNNTVIAYHFENHGTDNKYTILSSEYMKYNFYEKSIWNFEVDILGQSRNEQIEKVTTTTEKVD